MPPSVLSPHFAPCSEERCQYRVRQSKEYERKKQDMVDFWDCKDAEEYRKLEKEGKGVFDAPVYDPEAETIELQSKPRDGDDSHSISVRILKPRLSKAKGIFLFIHGGGFVIGSATLHDNVLRDLAERTSLITASVEYRLAPQFKLPAGTWDCANTAEYLLSEECNKQLGANLVFIGGESAGAYLTVQTSLELRNRGIDIRQRLAGILPVYGIADLSLLPSVRLAMRDQRGPDLPLDDEERNFIALALPKDVWNSKDLIKEPQWSPLYADLSDMPPAMFTVGTEDSLIDDSILLASRWELAGNEAELRIYPGAPHGYLVVDLDVTQEAVSDMVHFIKRHLK